MAQPQMQANTNSTPIVRIDARLYAHRTTPSKPADSHAGRRGSPDRRAVRKNASSPTAAKQITTNIGRRTFSTFMAHNTADLCCGHADTLPPPRSVSGSLRESLYTYAA